MPIAASASAGSPSPARCSPAPARVAWANAQQPWHLVPALLLSGAGWAAMSGAALNAIVAPWFDRDRPKAISMAFNGASVGGVALRAALDLA